MCYLNLFRKTLYNITFLNRIRPLLPYISLEQARQHNEINDDLPKVCSVFLLAFAIPKNAAVLLGIAENVFLLIDLSKYFSFYIA